MDGRLVPVKGGQAVVKEREGVSKMQVASGESVETQRECETPRPNYKVQQIVTIQTLQEERRGDL